jgi:tetratricopeptide (TPR) repeat protein
LVAIKSEQNASRIFDEALAAHSAGDHSLAQSSYEEVLSIEPSHSEAQHNIGTIFFGNSEYHRALVYFKKALEINPNISLFWAHYIETLIKLDRIIEAKSLVEAAKKSGLFCKNLAEISEFLEKKHKEPGAEFIDELNTLMDQKEFEETLSKGSVLEQSFPESFQLKLILGKSHFELEQLEMCILQYESAISIQPLWADGHTILGKIYESKSDLEKAILNYQQAIKINPNKAYHYNNLGCALRKIGKNVEASKNFKLAIKTEPHFVEAYIELGRALRDLKESETSIIYLRKLLDIEPENIDAHNLLGIILNESGHPEDALSHYRLILKINADSAQAFNNIGFTMAGMGNFDAALENYYKALEIDPNYASAHNNLGQLLTEKRDLDKARMHLERAIKINPQFIAAHNNLGVVLKLNGFFSAAVKAYERCLSMDPNYTSAHNNLGLCLYKMDNLVSAVECYKKAIETSGNNKEIYNNLGIALNAQGNSSAALDCYKKALEIDPNYADAYSNLGIALNDNDDIEAAIKNFDRALEILPDHPDANNNKSVALLKGQDFQNGFNLFEWRWKTEQNLGTPLITKKPLWKGEKGRAVFVWQEQGIGDMIMFASLIQELHTISSQLIIQCDQRLIPLFQRSFPKDINYHYDRNFYTENAYEFHTPIGSIARIFRTSLASFQKSSGGYLLHDKQKANELRHRLLNGDRKKLIGISWQTLSSMTNSKMRNVALSELAKALDGPKIQLVCLQYGEVSDEINQVRKDLGINIIQVPEINNRDDIDGLASIIMACDKIVSTTNATIHLAGALGADTKVLLPYSARWMWGLRNSKNSWYSYVKPYRQNVRGKWSDVLETLSSDLKNELASYY